MGKIATFKEFGNLILSEAEYYENTGKTRFTGWLHNIDNRVSSELGAGEYSSYYSDPNDPLSTIKSGSNLLPLALKTVTSGSAAIVDLLSPDGDFKSYGKLSKEEFNSKKKEIIEKWKAEHIEKKKDVKDSDAEKFYKSGVLKGKKYFGKNYSPTSPKNKDEEIYSDYINDIMDRYYKKIK
jgi:hypothetical protein